jgi:hypothetical protein
MAGFVGQNTDVDTTAEALASTQVVFTGVCLKAHPSNTGVIYVGLDNTVSATTGFPLAAGDLMSFDVGWFKVINGSTWTGDLANIWVIASTNNQVVAYWGV